MWHHYPECLNRCPGQDHHLVFDLLTPSGACRKTLYRLGQGIPQLLPHPCYVRMKKCVSVAKLGKGEQVRRSQIANACKIRAKAVSRRYREFSMMKSEGRATNQLLRQSPSQKNSKNLAHPPWTDDTILVRGT